MRKSLAVISAFIFIFSGFSISRSQEIKEYPLIVLSVKFSNRPNIHDFTWVQNQLFGLDNQSLNDYFWQCSTGKTRVVQGKFAGLNWFQAKKPLEYYAEDTERAFDIRARELIEESIVEALDKGLNPKDYEIYNEDWDAVYSQACIIVTGDQEGYQNFPRSDAFWPHASAIEIEYKGKTYLFRYFLACEGLEKNSVDLNLAWTAAHEYGHVMGLWDLYDYGCGGPFGNHCTFPCTYYDIMVARHKGQGMLGYHRERLGYIKPLVVEKSGEFKIKPVNTNDSNCYLKIPIPGTMEYLAVEYRKRIGIDGFWSGIPSEGVLIYRVSDDSRYGGDEGNSSEDGFYLLEILNPGKTKWHEKACYSIESGISTASAKTNPSTMPYNPEFTGTVKIEVISKMGDEITVKVTIVPRENISFIINSNRIFVGKYHKTNIEATAINNGSQNVTIKSLDSLSSETVELEAKSATKIDISLGLQTDTIPKSFEERNLVFESDNEFHKLQVYMINVAFILDSNKDGTVSPEEVSQISSLVGKPRKPNQDYDFNGNGLIDIDDLLIAAKYVGYIRE
jgi:M6 family metalloprotease-like protein